jgi:WD40 repeat protein
VAAPLPPLAAVAFSPDGRQVSAGSSVGGVWVWDAGTGTQLRKLDSTAIAAHGLCYSPDGQLLAAAGSARDAMRFTETGIVRTWDTRSGKERRLIQGGLPYRGVCFSPDGRSLACAVGVAGYPGEIKIYDADTGTEKQTFRGHLHAIPAVCFSPDGEQLASASWDWTVRVWDARDEQSCLTLPATGTTIQSLGFGSDGPALNSIGSDGMLRRWDPRTGREIQPPSVLGPKGTLAAMSGDGRRLAALGPDRSVKVCDVATNQPILTIPAQPQRSAVALSPDGLLLATSAQGAPLARDARKSGQITVWDVSSGRSLRDWPLRRGDLTYICFSPSGNLLAGVSPFLDSALTFVGSDVVVWDTAGGEEKLSLTFRKVHIHRVCFSPDGALLAVVGGLPAGQPGLVKLWDLSTGDEWRSLRGHTDWVEDVCFSPDGTRLATAGGIWDTQHRNYASGEVKLWDLASGQETLSLRSLRRWPVQHVAYSPDGRLLAAGDADGLIRLWHGGDPWQARPLRRATGDIHRVGFSDDGHRLIALAQLPHRGDGPGPDEPPAPELFGWDTRTGEEVLVAKDSMPAEAREALSPDGVLHAATDGTEVRVRRQADSDDEDRQLSLAWHFRQAVEAEKAGQWFAVRFHLDQLLAALPDDAGLKARRAAAVAAQAKAGKSKQ